MAAGGRTASRKEPGDAAGPSQVEAKKQPDVTGSRRRRTRSGLAPAGARAETDRFAGDGPTRSVRKANKPIRAESTKNFAPGRGKGPSRFASDAGGVNWETWFVGRRGVWTWLERVGGPAGSLSYNALKVCGPIDCDAVARGADAECHGFLDDVRDRLAKALDLGLRRVRKNEWIIFLSDR